jgi:hypothetical protein
MATSPSFISTPLIASVTASVANTNINGTGSINTLVTGAVTGTRILEITAQCAETSASALINIFISVDSGATWRLFDQISISPTTPNGTTKAFKNTSSYNNLVLKDSTHSVGVTTTVTQATNVFAFGGSL